MQSTTEPYNGGKGHALWQLNELNKLSKHEILVGACSISSGMDIAAFLRDETRNTLRERFPDEDPTTFKFDAGFLEQAMFMRPADSSALKVGDPLWSEPLDTKVHEQRTFAFDVSLTYRSMFRVFVNVNLR